MQGLVGDEARGLAHALKGADDVDDLLVVHDVVDAVRGQDEEGVVTVTHLKQDIKHKR